MTTFRLRPVHAAVLLGVLVVALGFTSLSGGDSFAGGAASGAFVWIFLMVVEAARRMSRDAVARNLLLAFGSVALFVALDAVNGAGLRPLRSAVIGFGCAALVAAIDLAAARLGTRHPDTSV